MKELNKKKIIILSIVLILIVAIIVAIGIMLGTNNDNEKVEKDGKFLISSEFESIRPKDIKITYDDEKKETHIKLNFKNITKNEVTKKDINIVLADKNDIASTSIQTQVERIEPKGEESFEITLQGDFSKTEKVIFKKVNMGE